MVYLQLLSLVFMRGQETNLSFNDKDMLVLVMFKKYDCVVYAKCMTIHGCIVTPQSVLNQNFLCKNKLDFHRLYCVVYCAMK